MNEFKQHIPRFIDADRFTFSFNTLDELLSHEWIADWATQENFYQYSRSDDLLMAEYNNGSVWYVLGYVKDMDSLNLPKWEKRLEKI